MFFQHMQAVQVTTMMLTLFTRSPISAKLFFGASMPCALRNNHWPPRRGVLWDGSVRGPGPFWAAPPCRKIPWPACKEPLRPQSKGGHDRAISPFSKSSIAHVARGHELCCSAKLLSTEHRGDGPNSSCSNRAASEPSSCIIRSLGAAKQ